LQPLYHKPDTSLRARSTPERLPPSGPGHAVFIGLTITDGATYPGGIGKTTLLRRFAADLPAGSCLYVDDHAQLPGILDPLPPERRERDDAAEDEARLGRIIDSLHAQADRAGSLVLVIDGFEPWSPAADWVREQLLPGLHLEKIRLITRTAAMPP